MLRQDHCSVSALLQQYRAAAGLSQEELAERSALSQRGISDIERGLRAKPHPSTLRRLADTLGLEAAERAALLAAGSRRVSPGSVPVPPGVPEIRHNLPGYLPPLIGRDDALAELRPFFVQGACGLLTLTGTGGCGKTRLAVELAREFVGLPTASDGIWFVDLAPLSDPTLLAHSLATVLGVRERAGEPLRDALVSSLEHRHLVLVLDNCEHLIEAVASLADQLLRACPGVRLLTTSRESLRVRGEITWRVSSLRYPDPQQHPAFDAIACSPAVRMFIARAQAVHREFELTGENARVVADICARLDGLPLAIELAAATIRVLSVDELRERLDNRFRLLIGNDRSSPTRHRTLQATLDWSYQLLTPAEQVVLRRLSVFAGGCSLEAAEAVCASELPEGPDFLEVLKGLLDKSLVVKTEVGGAARYGQLETVRQYGQHKLREAGEAALAQRHHAAWCRTLVYRAAPKMQTPEEPYWLTRLEAERDNLRAALEWCVTEKGAGSEVGLQLLDVLAHAWFKRQQQTEARRWIERILDTDKGPARPVRVRVLNWGAEFATNQGDLQRSDELADQGLTLARGLGYVAGEGMALGRLGMNASIRGLSTRAVHMLEEALRTGIRSGDELAISYARHKLAEVYRLNQQLDTATRLFEDNLMLARQRGDVWGIAQAVHMLGLVAEDRTDYARAAELLQESLSNWQAIGATRGPDRALLDLGRLALAQGDFERARKLIGQSLRHAREAWNTREMALCLQALASVAAMTGEATRGATLLGSVSAIGERVAVPQLRAASTAYARGLAAAQDQLGDAGFAHAWAEGRALSLQQALSMADDLVGPEAWARDDTPLPRSTTTIRVTRSSDPQERIARLTVRQTEVLRLVAEGMTDRQIAAELTLSEKTVGRHIENIYARLDVSSRAAATRVAVRRGVV